MGSSSNVNYSDLSNMIDEICRRYVKYIHMCSLALYLDRQEFWQCCWLSWEISISTRVNEAYSCLISTILYIILQTQQRFSSPDLGFTEIMLQVWTLAILFSSILFSYYQLLIPNTSSIFCDYLIKYWDLFVTASQPHFRVKSVTVKLLHAVCAFNHTQL